MPEKDQENEENTKPGACLGPAHREVFGVPIPMGPREIMVIGWMGTFGFNGGADEAES